MYWIRFSRRPYNFGYNLEGDKSKDKKVAKYLYATPVLLEINRFVYVLFCKPKELDDLVAHP